MKRYARRKKFKVKKLFILLFAVMLCVMAGKVLHSSLTTPFLGNITHHMASEDHGWNLILVNRENYIPADYEVQLTELSNGKKVDSRIYPELQEMFNDARAQGYGLFVREGYRTQEEQQQLLDEKIEAYENEGKSKSEAKKLAEQWVAIPGTSEHQLGIAVDINADTTKSSSDDVYSWLAENAHKYGFVLRFADGTSNITGITQEPWHFRYVGKKAAKIMYEGADADTLKEKAAEYKELQSSPMSAARRGYVDAIIEAADTRKYVIGAFEMLFTRREDRPAKKHGTV